ncbi:hypothetical protein [Corynebacterium glaucum]|uniref:hypothetical protein n=1 Tax=Corynebacterium glaucum TaxID=187491 RepID=UPI0025B3FA74|nr:hypothetical protein [Corynebacterium glaucum]WJZ07556.1 hypothetical protein CGLAUT_05295 [Corynebacterium glaucum]
MTTKFEPSQADFDRDRATREYTQESIESLRRNLAEREKARPKNDWQRFWHAFKYM